MVSEVVALQPESEEARLGVEARGRCAQEASWHLEHRGHSRLGGGELDH